MAKMKNYETKKVKIIPKKLNSIPDILINNKLIKEETIMDINTREIERAMHFGTVSALSETGEETSLNTRNFDDNSKITTIYFQHNTLLPKRHNKAFIVE